MTSMQSVTQALAFIIEIEKLKDVLRKSKPVGLDRYENSAEHSWHVCLTALALQDFSNNKVDIQKVIMMLLIHDLCEIDAGDVIIYESETPEHKAKEEAGMRRILGMLPETQSSAYMELWIEFESGESAESKFARAMDRIPPLVQNLNGDGHSWKENDVPKEKVFALNQRIGEGASEVWTELESQIQTIVDQGLLK